MTSMHGKVTVPCIAESPKLKLFLQVHPADTAFSPCPERKFIKQQQTLIHRGSHHGWWGIPEGSSQVFPAHIMCCLLLEGNSISLCRAMLREKKLVSCTQKSSVKPIPKSQRSSSSLCRECGHHQEDGTRTPYTGEETQL